MTNSNSFVFSLTLNHFHSTHFTLLLLNVHLVSSLKPPDWFRAFEWPQHSPNQDQVHYQLLSNNNNNNLQSDNYDDVYYTNKPKASDRYESRRSSSFLDWFSPPTQVPAPSGSSRWDYYAPLESQHNSHQHEMEHEMHGKEVGLAYPILLALLLLGALFIPFLSLFFFLAVNAFNCHGGGIGTLGSASSGFQPVAPFFGRRRRRKKRDLRELKLLASSQNVQQELNRTGELNQNVDSGQLDSWLDEELDANWATLLRALTNWLELANLDQDEASWRSEL